MTGMPLMTPAYASPEQVRGELYTVSGDVYSLGVILYELLAATALPGSTVPIWRWRARSASRSRRRSAQARRRAGTRPGGRPGNIVAKALAKESRLRYATVAELAEDVRRHLDGPPGARARRDTTVPVRQVASPASRRGRRRGAAAVLLIVGFAGAALWEARSAERRFQDVRTLAGSVIFELHDAIARCPGRPPRGNCW